MFYCCYGKEGKIADMVGLTFKTVERRADDKMVFDTGAGRRFEFTHCQDCCESVSIDDIVGDLDDLVGSPLLQAEEVTSGDAAARDGYAGSFTWTFYKFATIKGSVTVKWYGESNGYYSESVELYDLTDENA